MKILVSTMLKPLTLSVALLALFAVSQGIAKADPVTFSTSGVFTSPGATAGSGTVAVTFGSGANTLTLTFGGTPPTTLNSPTFFSAGTITTTATGTGATITSPTTLTITVTQTNPSIGTGNFTGTLTGTIAQNSSTGVITFTLGNDTVVIGTSTFTLPGSFLLVPPTSGSPLGVTTLQGTLTSVPEPTTMLLLGTGFVGVAARLRKRRKEEAAS